MHSEKRYNRGLERVRREKRPLTDAEESTGEPAAMDSPPTPPSLGRVSLSTSWGRGRGEKEVGRMASVEPPSLVRDKLQWRGRGAVE